MSPTSLAAGSRRRICAEGLVQGVGFRPFVYRLARQFQLGGFVANTAAGVTIEVEGDDGDVEAFTAALAAEAPPLAHIVRLGIETLPPQGSGDFHIGASHPGTGLLPLSLPPDLALCRACRAEVGDRANRRYGYAFTSCTECGPRYSIVRALPYDRPRTSMAAFALCPACAAEYHDPADRRFHAQPNACPVCGPRLWLADAAGGEITADDPLAAVRARLRAGAIVALKGLGGFQLACDAANAAAVARLRARKERGQKPFALMVRNLASAERLCLVSPAERALLGSPAHPIVILQRRPAADATIAPQVAPGQPAVGLMLAYTPLHVLLFGPPEAPAEFPALVMTSGNRGHRPLAGDNAEALAQLGDLADVFLLHDRAIEAPLDDSVTRIAAGRPRLLRRARGYVPMAFELAQPVRPLLACGAEQKNTFCLAAGRQALLSPHIGDMDNLETLEFFERSLRHLQRLTGIEPAAIAHDAHPHYATTRWALRQALPTMAVQHHHAHVVSCMGEHQLAGPVLGVAWDGTGYGSDGAIWGGEFLLAELADFRRLAHFRYASLAGGDRGARQGWRMALSWLGETYGAHPPAALEATGWLAAVPARERQLVEQMLRRRLNIVPTSSCGRLFDAVAALLGLKSESSFEGEAAMALEAAAGDDAGEYPYAWHEGERGAPAEIDLRPTLAAIVEAVIAREAVAVIAGRFHHTLAGVCAGACIRLRARTGCNQVCLSGGCFQNRLLLERTLHRLRLSGFEVFTPEALPANDGGIALGQVLVCEHRLRALETGGRAA